MESSQPRTVYPNWLFPLALITIALCFLVIGAGGTVVYFVGHPQISTVTYSTTGTVSQTQTETTTSFSTMTQTSVTTSISTQNAYNPNYQSQCYYQNCYQNNCYGQNCWQYQISQSGYVVSDTILDANGCYIQLINMPPGYSGQSVTVWGAASYTNSNSCPVSTITVTSVS